MQSVTASSLFGRGQCIPLFWFFSILYLSLLINLMVVSYFLISFLFPTNFVKCITPLIHREETKWIWWSYSPCVIMSDSPSFLGFGVNWWIKFYLVNIWCNFWHTQFGSSQLCIKTGVFWYFPSQGMFDERPLVNFLDKSILLPWLWCILYQTSLGPKNLKLLGCRPTMYVKFTLSTLERHAWP